jgi:hypothetical protein
VPVVATVSTSAFVIILVLLWVFLCGAQPSTGTKGASHSPTGLSGLHVKGALVGVSCPTVSDCWVIGSRIVGGPSEILEHWSGRKWQVVQGPPSVDGSSALDIDCPTSQSCWAIESVGGDFGYSYLVQWTKGRWFTPTSQDLYYQALSMSCPSTNGCMVVGNNHGDNWGAAYWNRSAWLYLTNATLKPEPFAMVALNPEKFAGVACTSSTSCWYVGQEENSWGLIENFAVAGHWTGHSKNLYRIKPRRETYGLTLSGISCTSPSFCVAVGNASLGRSYLSSIEPASAVWNGTLWSTLPTPTVSKNAALADVACSSPSDCLAIGEMYGSGNLLEHFNGKHWSLVHTPDINGSSGLVFNGVGVVSRSKFLVVGSTSGDRGKGSAIIEEYDGTSTKVLQD